MKKVWLVEYGDYSDYHVVGVFSSEENAQKVVTRLGDCDGTIREWVLDPGVEELNQGLSLWAITMAANGDTTHCALCTYDLESFMTTWKARPPHTYTDFLNMRVWAEDKVHAIKIVNERRIAMLASGELKG